MTGSSSTGATWIILLVTYFFALTVLVTLIGYIDSGITGTGKTIRTEGQATDERYIYAPNNNQPVFTTTMSAGDVGQYDINEPRPKRLLAHLDCERSVGVIGQSTCTTIQGCSWATPSSIWSWLPWYQPANQTCTGTINASYYGIESRGFLASSTRVVLPHNNSYISWNIGSICTHPSVIYNETLAELFSCVWVTPSTFVYEEITPSLNFFGMIGDVFRTFGQFLSFSFSWGFETEYINYIATFILFYIPLLILTMAIVVIVRA